MSKFSDSDGNDPHNGGLFDLNIGEGSFPVHPHPHLHPLVLVPTAQLAINHYFLLHLLEPPGKKREGQACPFGSSINPPPKSDFREAPK